MKKRKILSWVLSIALVFSMTSAFVVTVNADQEETNEIQSLEKNLQLDGAYEPTTVSSVTVNGVTLEPGEYIMSEASDKETGKSTTAPEGSGYAYFNGGHLVLNGFNLTDLTNYAISATSTENNIRTLYIDIIGQNEFTTTDSKDAGDVIRGENVNFILSEKEANASLKVTTFGKDGHCINNNINNNGNIIINSGEYTLETKGGKALYANDAIINGGNLKVLSAHIGIKATNRTLINGGTINISNCNYGIGCDNFLSITGGKINITDGYTGLTVERGSIAVDGLNTDIKISHVEATGICLLSGTFTMNGGYIKVSHAERNGIELSTGDFTMNGGYIMVSDVDEDGFSLSDGCFTMNGGKILMSDIEGYGMQFDGYGGYCEAIINNATVDIESTEDAIYCTIPVKINNSNVKAQSTTDDHGHYAIYPSVELTGNHTVYAGSTPADKELITSNDSLGTYQYVEIINEQTNFNNILGSIFSNITKLFTSTSKFNLGSMLSYLLIGKLLIKIIKIL